MKVGHTVTLRMMVGTGLLLLTVLVVIYAWRYRETLSQRREHLRHEAALTSRLVLRSFEAVEPGRRPVHTDSLARNLVELADIHNIVLVAADGTVAYSHHPDEVGARFDPSNEPACRSCHGPTGVHTTTASTRGAPARRSSTRASPSRTRRRVSAATTPATRTWACSCSPTR